MQVLSQLSYNPTSVHSSARISDAIPAGSHRLLDRRVQRSPIAGLHPPGSLWTEGSAYCSRVNAFAGEYISRSGSPVRMAPSGPDDRIDLAHRVQAEPSPGRVVAPFGRR